MWMGQYHLGEGQNYTGFLRALVLVQKGSFTKPRFYVLQKWTCRIPRIHGHKQSQIQLCQNGSLRAHLFIGVNNAAVCPWCPLWPSSTCLSES
jgi:hypothetical protein